MKLNTGIHRSPQLSEGFSSCNLCHQEWRSTKSCTSFAISESASFALRRESQRARIDDAYLASRRLVDSGVPSPGPSARFRCGGEPARSSAAAARGATLAAFGAGVVPM